jgi:hypothetical protein
MSPTHVWIGWNVMSTSTFVGAPVGSPDTLNETTSGLPGWLSRIGPRPVPVNVVVVPPPGTHVGDGLGLGTTVGVGDAGGVGLGVTGGPHDPV